jgi:hypothetical protein
MAVDWIKMRADLLTHPKVVRIASALKADKLRVIGGLHAVWCLFDAHTVDGTLDGYTAKTLDDHLGWPGFAGAMTKVGWLEQNGESLAAPRFDEHNGQSAKRRATEAERKRESRKASASDADKKRTREEKRRDTSPNGDVGADAGNKAPKGSRLPKAWAPSTDDLAFILAQRPDLNPKTTAEMFRDYWHSKPGKDGVRIDWPATWRNWVRNQRVLPGNTALASEWWIGGTKGTLDKGVELGLTAPPQGDNNAWYHFQAQVWAKMGEGPWLNPDSRSYPIYKSLRDGAAQEPREVAHAA